MGDNPTPGHSSTVATATDKFFHPYRRPIVAVDVALLTLAEGRLAVVELRRPDSGRWALPGTFLRDGETLGDAVKRCLRDKLGVHGVRPRQLQVFDNPGRDDRDWVISVAHVAVVRPEQLDSLGSGADQTRLVPVDRPGDLVWDHPAIVKLAKNYVRSRYETAADPEGLLGKKFLLRELYQVHNAVAAEELAREKFRRDMQPLVEETGMFEENTGARGRPAEYFRRRS